jgi:hypothetical protein
VSLFKVLPDRIFAPLAGPNKHMFEQCLLALYARFYEVNLTTPSREEVIGTIDEIVGDMPDLWVVEDEFTKKDVGGKSAGWSRARRAATYLEECGWLETSKSGYAVQMEFSPVALPLIKALSEIEYASSKGLEGVMQTLQVIFEKMLNGQEAYTAALTDCVRLLKDVHISMRATRTKMNGIRDEVFKGRNHEERFRILMDTYVAQVLHYDISKLMSESHPYRFKRQILGVIDTLMSDRGRMHVIGREFAKDAFPADMDGEDDGAKIKALEEGINLAYRRFDDLREALDMIEETSRSIMAVKQKIEGQLDIYGTIRLTQRGTDNQKIENMIEGIVGLMAARPSEIDREDIGLPQIVLDRRLVLHENALRDPPMPRRKPDRKVQERALPDPVMDFRMKLNDAYTQRITPGDDRIIEFLDRFLEGRSQAEFDEEALADIDDFVLASALLRIVVSGELPPAVEKRFSFEAHLTQPVNTKYMKCPGFTVYRTGIARYAA